MALANYALLTAVHAPAYVHAFCLFAERCGRRKGEMASGTISDDMSSAGWFVPLPGRWGGFLVLPLILIPGFFTAHPNQRNIIGSDTDKNGRDRE